MQTLNFKNSLLRYIGALIFSIPYAQSSQIPYSMSALGDSTSTATLAQYKRSRAMNPALHLNVIYDFLHMAIKRGDKFTLSDWKLSWTTGIGSKKVRSHAQRLKNFNPKLNISNFAVPSARIEHVWSTQLPRLKKWSQESLKKNYPDYITLMIGANDVCAENMNQTTSIKNFSSSYYKILTEILTSSQSTRILATPLPPLEDIKKAEKAPLLAFPGLSTCGGLWRVAPLCKSITHGNDDDLHKVKSKVLQMNRSILTIVNNLRKRFGDRVRFAHALSERRIHHSDLSVDCFHPNAEAQDSIAELTWSSTWWAK